MPEPVSHFDGYNDAFGFLNSCLKFSWLHYPTSRQNVSARTQESFLQFALCLERLYSWHTPYMSSWNIDLPQSWAESERQPMWFWQAQSKVLLRSLLKAPLYLSADSTEGNNFQRIMKTNPCWLKDFNNMARRRDINYQHFFPIWWIARLRWNGYIHMLHPPRMDCLALIFSLFCVALSVFSSCSSKPRCYGADWLMDHNQPLHSAQPHPCHSPLSPLGSVWFHSSRSTDCSCPGCCIVIGQSDDWCKWSIADKCARDSDPCIPDCRSVG